MRLKRWNRLLFSKENCSTERCAFWIRRAFYAVVGGSDTLEPNFGYLWKWNTFSSEVFQSTHDLNSTVLLILWSILLKYLTYKTLSRISYITGKIVILSFKLQADRILISVGILFTVLQYISNMSFKALWSEVVWAFTKQ